MKVLVLGGRGFIGRNVVLALQQKNVDVLVASRYAKQGQANYRQVIMQSMLKTEQWLNLLTEVDVVVNCIGILRERRGESYEAIHQLAPTALAKACKLLGKRLVHVSALGLSYQAKSRFLRSKWMGEQGILASKAEATIVRPSLLDGQGGFGAKWFRMVAQSPVHFVMNAPNGLIAPLKVGDLAEAIAVITQLESKKLKPVYELGATQALNIPSYLKALRSEYTTRKAVQITCPYWLVRAVSHLFDVVHFSPLSFGHVELMLGKNVPEDNRLPQLLNRNPQTIGKTINTEHLPLKVGAALS